MNLECKWKQLSSFLLAFAVGCSAFSVFSSEKLRFEKNFQSKIQSDEDNHNFVKTELRDIGEGMGSCPGINRNKTTKNQTNSQNIPKDGSVSTKPLNIISKPRAPYSDLARYNEIEGKVVLRITFLANGQIGNIIPVSGLPDGLTEQAIDAAGKIKFEPQLVNGQPKNVTKSVQYTFTIY